MTKPNFNDKYDENGIGKYVTLQLHLLVQLHFQIIYINITRLWNLIGYLYITDGEEAEMLMGQETKKHQDSFDAYHKRSFALSNDDSWISN